ncbi:winged helix-turn-helix domain-containing protein [Wolbachia endosymbiont of Litomosoides sigmodontis]
MLEYQQFTVYRNMQKMKFSYIMPRPIYNKQDKGKQEKF